MNHRMRTAGILAAVLVAGGLAACGSSAGHSGGSSAGDSGSSKITIMVGGLDKQIYLPAQLTQSLGYFKQEGLDVDLQTEPAGVDAETAMLAGHVDAVVGFYDHNIQLQAKGKTTESIVQFSQVPGEVELTANTQSGVRSPADWKGKNVGITGAGSSTDFLSQYLAVKAGLNVSDIHRVAVKAGQTFIAAMQHGQIVSGMTTEPTITAAVDMGLAHVMTDMRTKAGTVAALGGTYPAACLYAPTSWVNGHKAVVQKLADAFVKTLQYIATHSGAEITDHVPADFYKGVGKAKYAAALDAGKGMFTADGVMPSDGPQTVLSVLQLALPDVKNAKIDLAKTYTTEFAQAASAG